MCPFSHGGVRKMTFWAKLSDDERAMFMILTLGCFGSLRLGILTRPGQCLSEKSHIRNCCIIYTVYYKFKLHILSSKHWKNLFLGRSCFWSAWKLTSYITSDDIFRCGLACTYFLSPYVEASEVCHPFFFFGGGKFVFSPTCVIFLSLFRFLFLAFKQKTNPSVFFLLNAPHSWPFLNKTLFKVA